MDRVPPYRFPKVFPVVVNESSGGSVDTNIQIRRLPYPESEYNTNRTELDKGITLLGGVETRVSDCGGMCLINNWLLK